MIDRIRAIYVENEIELSWPIEPGAECYKNKIG